MGFGREGDLREGDLGHKSWRFGREGDLGHKSWRFGREGDLGHKSWRFGREGGLGHKSWRFGRGVVSGTNLGDLVKRVISGTNPGDLAERVISGTNLGDLAERVVSGTNPGDLAERVISGTNPGDLAEGILVSFLRDLEVMKAAHDLDTAVTKGSLAVIRERYSIPTEYGLHVSQPRQHPFSSDAPGMCISVDALEASLWFPLHPLIEECLKWWRISLSQTHRMDLDELRRMPKVSGGKAPSTRAAVPAREVPTRRHKSRHGDGDSRSHSKGKELAASSKELETPAESEEGGASPVHHYSRSMKDLFKTKVHKDDAGYYTLHMSDLGHQDPDKEMKARWRGLKNSMKIWNDLSATEEFERGLLHPQLARELYTLPSEVLLAQAAKEMVW
ncbi:hypothetical protein GW17_00029435 [Ensete ventricosum]|nr:hypothetical protein GW17_00029435 [Ensete ventricosum]